MLFSYASFIVLFSFFVLLSLRFPFLILLLLIFAMHCGIGNNDDRGSRSSHALPSLDTQHGTFLSLRELSPNHNSYDLSKSAHFMLMLDRRPHMNVYVHNST